MVQQEEESADCEEEVVWPGLDSRENNVGEVSLCRLYDVITTSSASNMSAGL